MPIFTNVPPLDWQTPIVNPNTGQPSLQFMQLWQQLFQNADSTNTDLDLKADKTTTITAGVGLSGGGNLSANRTIDLENTTVTPGAYTNTDLTVDAQGRITMAASGSGGGGGGSTPTFRSASAANASSNVCICTLPTGTIVGDIVIIFAAGAWDPIQPTGWTYIDIRVGSGYNGGCFVKEMVTADITAGNVTVTFNGSFDCSVAMVTLIGSTVAGIRVPTAGRQSGSGVTSTSLTSVTPAIGDLVIYCAANRANSTNTFSLGTLGVTNSRSASSIVVYSGNVAGKLGLSVTASFSTAGSGYYVGCVSLFGP